MTPFDRMVIRHITNKENKMKSAPALAKELNVSRKCIAGWCERLGYEKIGNIYVINKTMEREIRAHYHKKPGQPRRAK